MRLSTLCAATFLLASAAWLSAPAHAQTNVAANEAAVAPQPESTGTTASYASSRAMTAPSGHTAFSRLGFSAGISPLGINLQGAVNANRFINIRGVGNVFSYSLNNISVSGFNINGNVKLATAGVSVDVYPWPNHGFRVSPGALFYNQNGANVTMLATGGTSFTLNSYTYYSSPSNPVTGTGGLNLHTRNPAPTVTVGWGNLIPRKGGRWSVPFEVGAAMTGDPQPAIAFTGGQVCADPQGTVNCQNVVGNTSLNSNLQAQLVKYQNDLQPLRFYPVLSVGVGYSFPIRRIFVPAAF